MKAVIHCSDSPHRGDDASTIHMWHKQRGWDGIGYHWVILEDGKIQAGRPEYWQGAHVAGHNEDSIGICLMGDEEFTGAQLLALKDLYHDINQRYHGIEWYNHYELDTSKTCPNFDAVALLFEDI